MALFSQFQTFFLSPFGEASVSDELNRFLRGHRIINLEKKMIDGERGTGWLFLVEYGQEQKGGGSYSAKTDWREVLSADEFVTFDRLRALRKTIAERHGVPVYAVFTNDHLAAMVKGAPRSLKDLLAIPGVGESKVSQFGEEFLAAMHGGRPVDGDEAPGPAV